MEKGTKIIFSAIGLVLLIVAFYYATKAITYYTGYSIAGKKITEENKIALAKCLNEKGIKMYGAYYCIGCNNQKAVFGEAFEYIAYVECDRNGKNSQRELCLEKGINGYPTWEINNNLYAGEMSLEELSELAGCKI